MKLHIHKKAKAVIDHDKRTVNPHQWVNNYADYLYAYAIRRVNNEEQAKDLVQETFLAALENVQSFEGRSSEKTWLTSILKNKIFDVYRAGALGLKNASLSKAYPEFFNQANGHWKVEFRPKEFSVQDEDAIESKEFRRILQQCLEKLPAVWHYAFKMKFMEEENSKNICSELKVTQANYWVIMHRAKINLRACLQKYWL